jgi:hypothetical protein
MPSRAPQNAIGEPELPPTPLSPDFDPLATSCDLTALSGFGGSLHPCCPKTAPGFAGCSVRIVLRRSSLCTVPVELPESTSPFADRSTPQARKPLESRACSVRIALRRSSLRTVPAEPPEGTSPFPALLHPAGPKAAPVSRRSAWFDPKTHLSFPGRSSGPGAIIRRVSAVPATGGLRKSFAEASDLRFVASMPFPLPRLPGSMIGVPLRPATTRPEGFLTAFGPSDA